MTIKTLEQDVALKYSKVREKELSMDMTRQKEVKFFEKNNLRLKDKIIKMCIAIAVIGCPQLS
jgi:uncharacterized protein YdcH (DUF465 family)